jgi:hypothetical protein
MIIKFPSIESGVTFWNRWYLTHYTEHQDSF